MLRGLDLWRESCPSWEEEGSFLLLNPRLSETWRECVLVAEFPDLKDHVWLGTSGTSGNLKMVALARTALEANARAVNSHLGVTSRDVWLNPLPLFHVGGLGIVVRAALGGGVTQAASRYGVRRSLFAAQPLPPRPCRPLFRRKCTIWWPRSCLVPLPSAPSWSAAALCRKAFTRAQQNLAGRCCRVTE